MNDGEIFILVMVIFVIIGILIHIWFFSAAKKLHIADDEAKLKNEKLKWDCPEGKNVDTVSAFMIMWYLIAVFFGIIGLLAAL